MTKDKETRMNKCGCGVMEWEGNAEFLVSDGIKHRSNAPCYYVDDKQAPKPVSKNEPAFPQVETEDLNRNHSFTEYPAMSVSSCGGLTKRELFAALVLQGYSSIKFNKQTDSQGHLGREEFIAMVVGQAVQTADALIAELEKTK